MTYEEYMAEIEKLNKKAEELQAAADKIKAETAKAKQDEIQDARDKITASILDYLELLEVAPEDDKHFEELLDTMDAAYNEVERMVKMRKKIAEMPKDKRTKEDKSIRNFIKLMMML